MRAPPGAAAFIASAAKHLPPSDVWCILYPSLKHFLRSDVRDVDEKSLLLAMKRPVRPIACHKNAARLTPVPGSYRARSSMQRCSGQ